MHQAVLQPVRLEGGEDIIGGQRRGQRQGAAGQGLGQGQDIGLHVRQLPGQHGAEPPEAGEDFIEHQQDAMGVAQAAQAGKHVGGVEFHAARPLDDGLNNHGGDGAGLGGQQGVQRRLRRVVAGQVGDQLARDHALEGGVEAVHGIAQRHGREGIAVIAAAEAEELLATRLALVVPVLGGDLQRDLDRDGPRFRKERAVSGQVEKVRQAGRKGERGLVGQARQHDVRNPGGLGPDGVHDMGVVVAVAGGPPAGDAVDQFPPVGQRDT